VARATFSSVALFGNATFSGAALFWNVALSHRTEFENATFSDKADFENATFARTVRFSDATFSDTGYFGKVVFFEEADFSGAAFYGDAHFGNAPCSQKITSENATFHASGQFVDAKMEGTTSFEGATFKTEPPQFYEAKLLHQGTVLRGITWPPQPKDKKKAGAFIDAYLKLEMNRLQKHEDELDFFALELQSRRVLQESVINGSGLPIALYGLASNYGHSYARPLYALFAVAAVGTLVLLLSGAPLAPWQSLGMSVANTLNVFGLNSA